MQAPSNSEKAGSGTSPHFAAFSFVDRIDAFEHAKSARGVFAIPAGVRDFPPCLIAEAVGQLAAWVAMEHIDFRGRPVAALAHETRFHRGARPGDTLELDVSIEQCDDEAVAYHGQARAKGALLLELVDCLGPMLPLADFDDPDALRARLALLRNVGDSSARYAGVELPPLQRTGGELGRSITARFDVPREAPFFGDHFPRRPVFPATLLLQTQIGLALALAEEAGNACVPSRMTHVKVRSFTPPGQTLELGAEIKSIEGDSIGVAIWARAEDRAVATARLALRKE